MRHNMKTAALIDFGSTFTKVALADLNSEILLATTKAPTTVKDDVMRGLEAAMTLALDKAGLQENELGLKVASSSAAGGLMMIAVGLVPELTVEAARLAALSAGAKLTGIYSYELSGPEVAALVAQQPDIILLAGGTDGGNREVILHNAEMLAASALSAPVVMAGNKAALDGVLKIFKNSGHELLVTENVLPAVNVLNIEPARQVIREVFIRRIVEAKGIGRARTYLDDILMPTPTAVLQAARLLSDGCRAEEGLGDLLVVDVGGATTDVHSICDGLPGASNVILKGLPEPRAKRTVEGDLGVRHNVCSILETAGPELLSAACGLSIDRVADLVNKWNRETECVPTEPSEAALDRALARQAIERAVTRHSGVVKSYYTPMGLSYVQTGKDLSKIKAVIGTGGPLVNSAEPLDSLYGALKESAAPDVLKPQAPVFRLDQHYILYAMGLLAESHPDVALRMMKKYLPVIGTADRPKDHN